jgi:hypothetical protein
MRAKESGPRGRPDWILSAGRLDRAAGESSLGSTHPAERTGRFPRDDPISVVEQLGQTTNCKEIRHLVGGADRSRLAEMDVQGAYR